MAEPLRNPLWRAELPKRTYAPHLFRGLLASAFSVNLGKAHPDDFTPGYRPSLHRPRLLDRPAERFSRFQRVMRTGARNYEFFGMKVPITEEIRKKSTFFSGPGPHKPFGVSVFAKERWTGRSFHLDWLPEAGEGGLTLESILPALESVPVRTPFPIALSGLHPGHWFFGQRKAEAYAVSLFPPEARESYFERTFRPFAPGEIRQQFAGGWGRGVRRLTSHPRFGAYRRGVGYGSLAGLGVGLGLYALGRLGQPSSPLSINHPTSLLEPTPAPPPPSLAPPPSGRGSGRIRGLRDPYSDYGFQTIGAGPVSRDQHRSLTDFGSGRREGNPTSSTLAEELTKTGKRYVKRAVKGVTRAVGAYSPGLEAALALVTIQGIRRPESQHGFGAISEGPAARKQHKTLTDFGSGHDVIRRLLAHRDSLAAKHFVTHGTPLPGLVGIAASGRLYPPALRPGGREGYETFVSGAWGGVGGAYTREGGAVFIPYRSWVKTQGEHFSRTGDPRRLVHGVEELNVDFGPSVEAFRRGAGGKPFVSTSQALFIAPFRDRRKVLGELKSKVSPERYKALRRRFIFYPRTVRDPSQTLTGGYRYVEPGDVLNWLTGTERGRGRLARAYGVAGARAPRIVAAAASTASRVDWGKVASRTWTAFTWGRRAAYAIGLVGLSLKARGRYQDRRDERGAMGAGPVAKGHHHSLTDFGSPRDLWNRVTKRASEWVRSIPGKAQAKAEWMIGFLPERTQPHLRRHWWKYWLGYEVVSHTVFDYMLYRAYKEAKGRREGRIEGIRQANSQHGFDTMGAGPIAKAQHRSLTDFGSGRDSFRQLAGWVIQAFEREGTAGLLPRVNRQKLVGEGAYGAVYGGRFGSAGFVAKVPHGLEKTRQIINELPGSGRVGTSVIEAQVAEGYEVAAKEAKILERLRSIPGIPHHYGYDEASKTLLMERVKGRAAVDMAIPERPEAFRRKVVRDLQATFLRALRRGFKANDVHGRNVLVTGRGKANVVDVGLFKELEVPADGPPFGLGIFPNFKSEIARATGLAEDEVAGYVGEYRRGVGGSKKRGFNQWVTLKRGSRQKLGRLERQHAYDMAYGRAATGRPLNEMPLLDKPRHHAAGFEGSWLSGAWRRFHDLVLTSTTAVEVMKKAGARSSLEPLAFRMDLFAMRGRAGEMIRKALRPKYREAVKTRIAMAKYEVPQPRFWELWKKGQYKKELRQRLGRDLRKLKEVSRTLERNAEGLVYNQYRIETGSKKIPALNKPSSAFHELLEESYFKQTRGKRMLFYGESGGHVSLGVVKGELQSAELYDYVHGTTTLKEAIALRRGELLELKDWKGSADKRRVRTTTRYAKRAAQLLDIYESGRYSFVREIQKGKGNVRQYFPEGWLEQVARPGIGSGPTIHGMPSVGDYNQFLRAAFYQGKAGLSTVLLSSARGSGIRSQRRRLQHLPNGPTKAGRPRRHPNRTRAGVS